jgi:transglutaminase-like putative cysteine protease
VSSFSDGLARVRTSDWYGYIDKNGERRFPVPPGYGAGSFSEGFAVVRRDYEGYQYIDKMGRFAFPEAYAAASDFHEGVAHVRLRDGKGGAYIDTGGRRVFEYK